ncbi:MAG: ribosome biogenesis GTPase Der, partial [Deltaproteobacteria bacterium]|nr:ribosome biogenesis GTPase Der [Deltaproteobacteria bacterium]
CVVLLNKWDLVEKDTRTAEQYLEAVRDRMRFLRFAPAMTVSAMTGQRTFKIFDRVQAVYEQYTSRVGTGHLNRVLEAMVTRNPPPMSRGRRIKFYYATQTAVAPPTFVCFVNDPEGIHFSYERYMINQFRETLALTQTPIRLAFRKRKGKR